MKYQLVIGIIIGCIWKVLYDADYFKTIPEVSQYSNCKYLDVDIIGPEDMANFDDNTIIVGQVNEAAISRGLSTVQQYSIHAIITNGSQFDVRKLKVFDFPSGISLITHGIYISHQKDASYLYAINHAYNFGGERIEKFRFDKDLNLHHENSIIADTKYTGILNDLVVISNDRLLVTKFQWQPSSVHGIQHNSAWSNLANTVSSVLQLKNTYVLDCRYKLSAKQVFSDCTVLENTAAVVANGITWDQKETVYVSDSVGKVIQQYKLLDEGLLHQRTLKIGYGLDNIEYKNNTLLIGMMPKLFTNFILKDHMKANDFNRTTQIEDYAAVGRYDLQNDKLEILLQGGNINKGLSSAAISGDNIYLGSWCDISVMVCRKNKN